MSGKRVAPDKLADTCILRRSTVERSAVKQKDGFTYIYVCVCV
jgi:hypothetical protein